MDALYIMWRRVLRGSTPDSLTPTADMVAENLFSVDFAHIAATVNSQFPGAIEALCAEQLPELLRWVNTAVRNSYF